MKESTVYDFRLACVERPAVSVQVTMIYVGVCQLWRVAALIRRKWRVVGRETGTVLVPVPGERRAAVPGCQAWVTRYSHVNDATQWEEGEGDALKVRLNYVSVASRHYVLVHCSTHGAKACTVSEEMGEGI